MKPMIMKGVKHKTIDPDNWMFDERTETKKVTSSYIPEAWSIKSKFPAVYHQGQINDCTTNAVIACDDYYYHGLGKSWKPSMIFTYYNQKALVDKEKLPLEDDGSSVEAAIKAVKRYGVCNSKVWSNDEPFDRKPTEEAYENGLKGHEIKKYYRIKTLLQIKKALYLGYPVPGVVDWAFSYYDEDFIMNNPTRKEIDRSKWGHAIVFVGYDDSKKLIEFRNSWGDQWGNGGYAYLTYETLKRTIWWDDTYAIVR